MTAQKNNLQASLRIIWAIALKDILDAIQNKTVLGIMIGVGFMMLSSQALPLLARGKNQPPAVIFDQGNSDHIRELVRSRELRLRWADSFGELVGQVGQFWEPVLGLVIPANFDASANGSSAIKIQGFTPHWANPSEVADLVIYFEESLSASVGHPVRILVDGNWVYPKMDDLGSARMITTGIVLGVMTIGLILVPILLLEEKETHTLAALLISPANTYHLLLGKSLAGLFYALVASLVIFIFSGYWIVHWWVVILAVVLGALCAVVTGLLIGSVFENINAVNLWVGLIIAFFLLPVFLWPNIAPRLPEAVQSIAEKLPSLAMSRMVAFSLVENTSFAQIAPEIIVMFLYVLLFSGLVAWRIRILDR